MRGGYSFYSRIALISNKPNSNAKQFHNKRFSQIVRIKIPLVKVKVK